MRRMQATIQVFSPAATELEINRNAIKLAMGYDATHAPFLYAGLVDELLEQAQQYLALQTGYRIFPPGEAKAANGRVQLQDTILGTGKLIAGRLKKIAGAAIFTATAGAEFDAWLRQFFAEEDPVSGFIADLIGSEYVEAAADWIEEKISGMASSFDLGCSNRYSPGYCSWNVAEQHKLFAFLPTGFCGISLCDSALMQPVKSVSGIIGIGPAIVKKEYQCNICNLQDCYKRQIQPRKSQHETS